MQKASENSLREPVTVDHNKSIVALIIIFMNTAIKLFDNIYDVCKRNSSTSTIIITSQEKVMKGIVFPQTRFD